jgi:hypothetical protein
MSSSDKKSPLFSIASAPTDDNSFEEDEGDAPETSSLSSSPASKPFTLFSSSFITPTIGSTFNADGAKAGVVEGEEDEDEYDSPSAASESGTTTTSNPEPATTGTNASPTKAGTTAPVAKKTAPARQYSRNERKVVDMNQSLRKAPVKKLKETFSEIRSELAPTQASLAASIRAANEVIGQCIAIDERLAQLGERIQTIKPLFSL